MSVVSHLPRLKEMKRSRAPQMKALNVALASRLKLARQLKSEITANYMAKYGCQKRAAYPPGF